MFKFLAAAVIATALPAAALAQAAKPESPSPTSTAAAPAGAAAKPADDKGKKPPKPALHCEYVKAVDSFIEKKVCKTQAEWDAENAGAAEYGHSLLGPTGADGQLDSARR